MAPTAVQPFATRPGLRVFSQDPPQTGSGRGAVSLHAGDVNGDGFADVVTSGHRGHEGDGVGGSVTTYLGGGDGVRTGTARTVHQGTPGVPGADEDNDHFGWAVSVGDVDGDGRADVAVSAFYEDIGAATLTGTVLVFRGSPVGLSAGDATAYHQDTAGVPGVPGVNEDDDHFGSSVRLADLDGDHHADLSVGADGENAGAGAVWSLRGSSSGLTTKNAVSFGAAKVGLSTSGPTGFAAGTLD
jgi:hypothetical protein